MGSDAKERFIGAEQVKDKKSASEWVGRRCVFAVVAATLIRTFVLRFIPYLQVLWKDPVDQRDFFL